MKKLIFVLSVLGFVACGSEDNTAQDGAHQDEDAQDAEDEDQDQQGEDGQQPDEEHQDEDTEQASDDEGDDSEDGSESMTSDAYMCSADYPGVPMDTGLIEDDASYATPYQDEVSDYSWSVVPDPFGIGFEQQFFQSLVQYMLESPQQLTFSHEEALEHGPLGEAVLNAFVPTEEFLDTQMLRRGFHENYYCSRPIPITLDAFKETYGDYTTWDDEYMECGAPKDLPRQVYRSDDRLISVAETIGFFGEIRETEILFGNLRDDGQLDFAVYTPEGELTDRSSFATFGPQDIHSASPYTCLSCHFDRDNGLFGTYRPIGTGAGCQ